MKYSLPLFILLILFCACQKEKDLGTTIEQEPPKEEPPLEIVDYFTVGSKHKYLRFEINDRDPEMDNQFIVEYKTDTMVVEIVEEVQNGFLIKESFSEGYIWQDTSFEYVISLSNDSMFLHVDQDYDINSVLLYNYCRYKFPLINNNFAEATVITSPPNFRFTGLQERKGILTEYQFLDCTYNDLILFRDYTAMAWDGAGYFYAYNFSSGIIKSYTIFSSQVTGQTVGSGWALLCNQ